MQFPTLIYPCGLAMMAAMVRSVAFVFFVGLGFISEEEGEDGVEEGSDAQRHSEGFQLNGVGLTKVMPSRKSLMGRMGLFCTFRKCFCRASRLGASRCL